MLFRACGLGILVLWALKLPADWELWGFQNFISTGNLPTLASAQGGEHWGPWRVMDSVLG